MKLFVNKEREYDDIIKKFQKVKENILYERNKSETSISETPRKSSQNPYKRENSDHLHNKGYYHSLERQIELENRRHRNSSQKNEPDSNKKSNSSRKYDETRSVEKTGDYTRILNEQPLQVVNLDLYKAAFEDDKYNEPQNKSQNHQFKKFINPFIDDDYEEITQTIENGVVVKEVKKSLKQKPRIYSGAQISHMGDTGAHYEIKDINENFETKDIDEEEKEIGFKVQAHYL